MRKVLISGGTGLIGKRLSILLQSKGYEVRLLSRSKKIVNGYQTFLWDVDERYIDEKAFVDLDYIIHLAGAGIADKKWTEKRKKIIIDSRVQSTELLLQTVRKLKIPIKAFISSSAIGYYGSITSNTVFEESHQPNDDFLGEVCQQWEGSVFKCNNKNIRKVAIRTGIVLSKNGGALSKMKTPIITPLGNGKQYMPWIHIDDLCEMYIKALEDESIEGAFNAVSPEHQTNKLFSKILAKSLKKPFLSIGLPSLILKLVFGEMATILLNGSRVSSEKIKGTGFSFKYPILIDALEDLNT
tara:strand:- start:93883 stop:94776 length:894 start_codon:yes stop_codon:yes gene_type:complete